MATRETLLLRASRLRAAREAVDDPLARQILSAVIDALEEAAKEKGQLSSQ